MGLFCFGNSNVLLTSIARGVWPDFWKIETDFSGQNFGSPVVKLVGDQAGLFELLLLSCHLESVWQFSSDLINIFTQRTADNWMFFFFFSSPFSVNYRLLCMKISSF